MGDWEKIRRKRGTQQKDYPDGTQGRFGHKELARRLDHLEVRTQERLKMTTPGAAAGREREVLLFSSSDKV
jgi:hypothetical protein